MDNYSKEIPINRAKEFLTTQGVDVQALMEKERAALTICGGLLGNCYLMSEIIDSEVTEIMAIFKSRKWFRQDLKNKFNIAVKTLRTRIKQSRDSSPSDSRYMMEISDALYDVLKADLAKLKNGVSLSLTKYGIRGTDLEDITNMYYIHILFQYVVGHYDNVIQHCKEKIMSIVNYDSWYSRARCTEPANGWWCAMCLFAERYLKCSIDINNNIIVAGAKVLQQKMDSVEITEIVKKKASENAEEGKGQELFDKALETLHIEPKEPEPEIEVVEDSYEAKLEKLKNKYAVANHK